MYIETISVLQSVLEYTCIEDRNQVCNVLCVRVICIVKRDQICTVICVRAHVYCSRQKTSSVLHSESESTCIVDRNQFCTYSVLECICIVNRDQICTVFCVGSHKCFRQKLVLYCTLSQSTRELKIETSSVLYSVLKRMSILHRDLFCIVSCEIEQHLTQMDSTRLGSTWPQMEQHLTWIDSKELGSTWPRDGIALDMDGQHKVYLATRRNST